MTLRLFDLTGRAEVQGANILQVFNAQISRFVHVVRRREEDPAPAEAREVPRRIVDQIVGVDDALAPDLIARSRELVAENNGSIRPA